MGQKSGFFTSNDGDRKYGADWLAQFAAAIISNGVYTTELTISGDNGNMSVTAGTGRAWINGYMYSNDADMTLALAAADGALSRTDLVVLRMDMTNRQIELAVVQGTFGGGVPAITRTADIYELELAKIAVAAGTTAITQAMITDTRADETVCGIVAGAVTQLSTGELLNQLKAGFDTWFANIKGQLSTDAAGNLQNEIDALPSTLKVTAATAAKLFASPVGTETVDDALSLLGTAVQYWWKRRTRTYTHVIGSASDTIISSFGSQTIARTVQYSSSINVDSNGNISLASPIYNASVSYSTYSNINSLKGKFFANIMDGNYNTVTGIYYVASDAANATRSGAYSTHIYASEVTSIAVYGDWKYLQSNDRSAYPDSGISGGYEYEFLGKPLDNAANAPQIAIGSYTGTGTYGANNPCSLTLPFVPKLILLLSTGTDATGFLPRSQYYSASLYMPLVTTQYVQGVGFCNNGSNDSLPTYLYGKKSSDGKTIMWYNTHSAAGQCNENGLQHNLIALG